MNIQDFKRSMEFTLKWEGGWVNDPDDPGGETKWGISKRSYPDLDIKNLSEQEAVNIYLKDYWFEAGCDSVSYPMNLVVFDSAVNCGVATAKKWMRESEGPEEVIELRKSYYINLAMRKPAMSKFLKGWLNRIQDLKKVVAIASS
jgi:lysozyme family protein